MTFPKAGDKTSTVKSLQLALITKFGKTILPKFGADGGFGKETTDALRHLQQLEGLPTTGIVDDNTWGKLFNEGALPADSSISLLEAQSWSVAKLEDIANKHIEWAKANNRATGTPRVWTEDGCLNVMSIRNNHENEFNRGTYNDVLICWMPGTKHIFAATTDPATVSDGKAHLRQGAWNSYEVRPHKWASMFYKEIGKTRKRWAFCQDKDVVEVLRTDGHGNTKGSERGKFGINVHDCFKEGADTSIGCTVLKEMHEYCTIFVPMIISDDDRHLLKNHSDLTYLLINSEQLAKYI